tara:strand:+ start:236 stop:514 length:279 start_codon:yes stop_codon:yes gene_type:complete
MLLAHNLEDQVVVEVERVLMNLLEALLLQSQDYRFHQPLKDSLVVLMTILPHIMVAVAVVLVLKGVMLFQESQVLVRVVMVLEPLSQVLIIP